MKLACMAMLALTLACPTVHAAAPVTPFLEELTWTELAEAVAAGNTTVLVPIGGTEQNGPHMALGKHNVRARLLAAKIAGRLGNAIVAPVIAYVPEGNIAPPSGHMRFAGTISVPAPTFIALLEATGRSLRAAGFRDVIFLGDHGGYQNEERVAAEHLNREWAHTRVRAHAVEAYYRATETAYRRALESRGFKPEEIGVHAGLADTALTLALDPALVRTDRLAAATQPRSGVQGDPRRATPELGELGVDLIVNASVDAIERAVGRRH